jgi:hypothetical protein
MGGHAEERNMFAKFGLQECEGDNLEDISVDWKRNAVEESGLVLSGSG